MADQGVVTEATEKYAVIGSTRYYWGRDLGQRPKAGDRIEYDWNEFGDARGRYGKPRGLTKWRPVRNASGAPQTASTVTDIDYLRSVSNIVAAAIQSGLVKEIESIEKACMAARMGLFRAMSKAKYEREEPKQQRQTDPEFDDSIPFGDEPPPREPGEDRW